MAADSFHTSPLCSTKHTEPLPERERERDGALDGRRQRKLCIPSFHLFMVMGFFFPPPRQRFMSHLVSVRAHLCSGCAAAEASAACLRFALRYEAVMLCRMQMQSRIACEQTVFFEHSFCDDMREVQSSHSLCLPGSTAAFRGCCSSSQSRFRRQAVESSVKGPLRDS